MKRILFASFGASVIGAILASLAVANPAAALSVFQWVQGGTGNSAYSPNSIITSDRNNKFVSTSTQPLYVGSIFGTTTASSTLNGGLSVLNFAQTGSATSTFNTGIRIASGCYELPSGTCLSAGGSGTVTNIATTFPILGGPITTTGTLTFAGLSTSTPAVIGNIPYFSGVNTFANVATSSLSVTGPITFSGTLGAQIGGAAGSFGCASCSTFGFPFTYTTNFGQTVAGTSTALWLQATPVSLMASSTAYFSALNTVFATTTNASTTKQSVSTYLNIPNSANPTVNYSGDIAIDTTVASSSITYNDGTAKRALYDVTSVSFAYATSSPAGTTTIQVAGPIRSLTYTQMGCNSVGGTFNAQIGNGSASSTMVVSSNSSTATTYTTLSSNNTFTQGQVYYIALGTWSSTGISNASCSFGRRYNP